VTATLVAIGRAVVGLALVASGSSKLGNLSSFAETVRGIGVARRYALGLGAAVSAVETGLGLAVFAGLRPFAIDAAVLALLLVFVGVATYAWRTTPELRCRCFGSLSESKFGVRTLARTVGLAAGAALVVAGERIDTPRYAGGATAARVIVVVAALALAAVSVQAARTLDIVRRRAPSS
jgi:uncharacterized membrane protein YphA (DoxX/SURF4 family)